MGSGGKGGGKISVTDYRMSLHYRVCHGPVDALLGIYVGEKEAWVGEVAEEQDITINRPDLFGGNKKEGGVVGVVRYLPGGEDQVMPSRLAARLGLTTATCPAYRGMASLFFTGPAGPSVIGEPIEHAFDFNFVYGSQGFLWASNNPYLKSIWMKVRRAPRGLDPDTAMIGPDANGAHIVYECMVNTDWGSGEPPTTIDTASFEAVAQTLVDESFGLSLMWTKQTTVEDFVQEVLDHIRATVFVHPRTGLKTIKLFRGDYDIEDLPILNVHNCRVTSFSRKGWGETVNEMVVTWTNPENEQEETVSAQNNANIAIQGGIISDSRNYYGVRNADLGTELAFRELALSSSPLAVCEIEADRSSWDMVPGACARLQYPIVVDGVLEDVDIVIRISDVDYGKPGAPAIKLSAMEDIFALDRADFDAGDDSQWDDPARDPEAADLSRVITAPYFLQSRSVGEVEYPTVHAVALVSPDNDDTYAYHMYGEGTLPNGTIVADLIGTRPTLGHALMPDALVAEALTTIETFGPAIGGPGSRPSGFVIIGNVAEQGHEIALIQSYDPEDGWLLHRGVLDTVPRPWPDGTPCWFVSIDSAVVVAGADYIEGETARFRIAPMTSRGAMSLPDAPIIASVMSARPHLPLRPAHVTVGGAAFGSVDLSSSPPATVTVTWSNRNRLLEDAQVLAWTDATVAVEDGQVTRIKVISTTGDVVTTHDGLTGTSFELPAASFGDENVADVAVYAVRDGLESLQGHRVRVKIRNRGWGDLWDEDWGGGGTEPPIGDPSDPPPPDPDPGSEFPELPPWQQYVVPFIPI